MQNNVKNAVVELVHNLNQFAGKELDGLEFSHSENDDWQAVHSIFIVNDTINITFIYDDLYDAYNLNDITEVRFFDYWHDGNDYCEYVEFHFNDSSYLKLKIDYPIGIMKDVLLPYAMPYSVDKTATTDKSKHTKHSVYRAYYDKIYNKHDKEGLYVLPYIYQWSCPNIRVSSKVRGVVDEQLSIRYKANTKPIYKFNLLDLYRIDINRLLATAMFKDNWSCEVPDDAIVSGNIYLMRSYFNTKY